MSSLSPDIILEVMHYLRRPLPPAHTLLTERSEIRQPDLFACLRVCKLWYNCAAPTLYKYAVTDNFSQFLHRQRGTRTKWAPNIAGIIPKSELLPRVQRLFIEYSHKDAVTYDEADEAVGWVIQSLDKALGDRAEESRRCPQFELGIQLASEARQLSAALGGMTGSLDLDLPTVFRGLRTLSVGAFFGYEEEDVVSMGECKVLEVWGGYGQMVRDNQRSFRQFVARIPALESYCQTPSFGSLSFGETAYIPAKTDSRPSIAFHTYELSIAFHIPNETDDFARIVNSAFGVPSSVYYHRAQRWDRDDFPLVQAASDDALASLLQRNALARKELRTIPDWTIDQTSYHSVCPRADAQHRHRVRWWDQQPRTSEGQARWRLEIGVIQEAIRAKTEENKTRLLGGIHAADKLEWKQLFDAPPCGGCGWRYEE